MKVKGTAVKSIPEYVKNNHPEDFSNWMESLPPASKDILKNNLVTSGWYSLSDAAIEPSMKVAEKFFSFDQKKASWELGRYSAQVSLTGIYKLYVRMSSPGHIISRAGRIMSAYYDPADIEVAEKSKSGVTLHLKNFDDSSALIEYRIAGWIERALELSGCDNVKIEIPKSLTKGMAYTEFKCSWN